MKKELTVTIQAAFYLEKAKKSFQLKDYKSMVDHLEKAVQGANPDAEYWLACAYEYGLGVDQNHQTGLFWLQMAADHGVPDAQFRLSQYFFRGIGTEADLDQGMLYLKRAAKQNLAHAQYELALIYYDYALHPDDPDYGLETEKKAFHWTNCAIKNGHDDARALLGLLHYYGLGTPENVEEGLRILEPMAENGNLQAQNHLAYFYINGIGVEKNTVKGHSYLKKAAQSKNPDAAFQLGKDLRSGGDGIQKDFAAARNWLEYAIDLGSTDALVTLGIMYYEGEITKNDEKAFSCFSQAAAQENYYGLEWVAYCYYFGFGVAKDLAKSIEYYEKAAEFSQATSAPFYMLGIIHGYELNPPEDEKAAHWFLKAAQLGNPDAQLKIGFFYHHGRGVEQSYEKAFYWFEHSARQGNLTAVNNLGDAFLNGYGVEKNPKDAYVYFRQAAEGGEIHAMFDLGLLLYTGDAGEKDPVSGLHWIRKAADQGNDDAAAWLKEEGLYLASGDTFEDRPGSTLV
jgi:TPR repeat protein